MVALPLLVFPWVAVVEDGMVLLVPPCHFVTGITFTVPPMLQTIVRLTQPHAHQAHARRITARMIHLVLSFMVASRVRELRVRLLGVAKKRHDAEVLRAYLVGAYPHQRLQANL